MRMLFSLSARKLNPGESMDAGGSESVASISGDAESDSSVSA